MGTQICTNYEQCRLVNATDYAIANETRQVFLNTFCEAGKDKWQNCKRFVMKEDMGFCPDFVLPNTALDPDEIVDKFDSDEQLQ
jgi:hypothetical protein